MMSGKKMVAEPEMPTGLDERAHMLDLPLDHMKRLVAGSTE